MTSINSLKTPYLYSNNTKNIPPSFGRHKLIAQSCDNTINISAPKTKKFFKKTFNTLGGIIMASLLAFTAVGTYIKNNKEANQDSTQNYITLYNNALNGTITHKNQNAVAFINGLVNQKTQLQQALNLNDEEYKQLAILAIGIANQETNMGLDGDYILKKTCTTICDILKGCNSQVLSKGLSNIKIGQKQQAKTQTILNQFGINEDNIYQPEQAAAATIIILAGFKNNYEKAVKDYNIIFNPQTTLTKEEYMLARFNGIPVKIQDGLYTNSTHSANIKAIIADRESKKPKTYPQIVLKEISITKAK